MLLHFGEKFKTRLQLHCSTPIRCISKKKGRPCPVHLLTIHFLQILCCFFDLIYQPSTIHCLLKCHMCCFREEMLMHRPPFNARHSVMHIGISLLDLALKHLSASELVGHCCITLQKEDIDFKFSIYFFLCEKSEENK